MTGLGGLGKPVMWAALDVTETHHPRWLTDLTIEGADVRFQTRARASYFAFALRSVKTPLTTRVDSLTRLTKGRADYLVITPEELKESAEELAGRGLRAQVVTLDTIHDEFGHGLASPHAVKSFLRHVHESWRRRPRFVVLLGKGTIDFLDNWGNGDNLNTPLLAATPLGLYASDNRLADVSGDDGVPEFMIGRIPVLSNEELRDFIDKLRAYETVGLGEALFFADNPDIAGDFIADSETVRALVPKGTTTHPIYVGPLTGPDARAAIFDRLDQGVGFANYIGHGALDRFANEGLIMSSDVPLSNSMTPILASLTCTVGRFEIPGWASLGESLVTQPHGGTVATWAPSGLSYNQQAMILNRAFVEALYDDETTYLGEAIQHAFKTFADDGELPFMLSIYNLLGDPATTLR